MNEGNKAAIEAILFALADPVSYQMLSEWLKLPQEEIKLLLEEMQKEYQDEKRGITLFLEPSGCQLGTKLQYSELLMRIQKKPNRRLSMASLETLAIIAYQQPVTRPQIEEIRGIKSEKILRNLLERNLIRENGKLDVPGRPVLYETTEQFLEQFSLRSLKDLPLLEK